MPDKVHLYSPFALAPAFPGPSSAQVEEEAPTRASLAGPSAATPAAAVPPRRMRTPRRVNRSHTSRSLPAYVVLRITRVSHPPISCASLHCDATHPVRRHRARVAASLHMRISFVQ